MTSRPSGINSNTAPVIVWFRQDLRLSDNPALHAAAATGRPVICLYLYEGQIGAASQWWLHHSLSALAGTLVIRRGDALSALQDVIKETGAQTVYWNRVYEPQAIARDTHVKAALREAGIEAQSFKGNLLFEPWELKPYKVFTPYYKACLARADSIAAPLPAPDFKALRLDGLRVADLGLLPRLGWDKGFDWQVGESAAHARLADFIDGAMGAYSAQRDLPHMDGTSRLSPHLHFGEISHRTVWHMAGPHKGSEAFLRQIFWREFSAHLLYHNPDMPRVPLQPKFEHFPWEPDAAALRAWQQGQTGYPIIDAGMRQLWQTGWMHNRVRMIVGSFLVKHLLQPWQDGQAWFWDTLVDADLANNSAGWQWIAGCGADAAPYFRVFNPILQGQKFDPEGAYIRAFVPELQNVPNEFIHTPWEYPHKTAYVAPMIDHTAGRNRALEAYAKVKNNSV